MRTMNSSSASSCSTWLRPRSDMSTNTWSSWGSTKSTARMLTSLSSRSLCSTMAYLRGCASSRSSNRGRSSAM
eukprot:39200-Eustigmatos_ZCMA.PRE.1